MDFQENNTSPNYKLDIPHKKFSFGTQTWEEWERN